MGFPLWAGRFAPALVVAAVAWGSVSPVFADVFESLDSNEDGVLSGKESAGLKFLDNDEDGEISRGEFDQGVAAHIQRLEQGDSESFAKLDQNEDGRLSGKELRPVAFTDVDGDGRVTLDEYRDGLRRRRAELAGRDAKALRATSEAEFAKLDITEDGRLSGTELAGAAHYDLDGDGRVTRDEFLSGMMLDALAGGAPGPGPSPDPGPAPRETGKNVTAESIVAATVDAINRQDGRKVVAMMHPELKKLVDEPLFAYLLFALKRQHGEVREPAAEMIERSAPGEDGSANVIAPILCDEGEIKLHLTLAQNQFLGFQFETPVNDALQTLLAKDLVESEEWQDRFAKGYSPRCQKLIRHGVAGEVDEAIAMFHPQVIESVGRDKYEAVLGILRDRVGGVKSIELETFGNEQDESNNLFMTISHRLTGEKLVLIVENRLQFVGMSAALVSIATKAPEDSGPVPPAPMPSPDAKSALKPVAADADGLRFKMPGTPERIVNEEEKLVSWQFETEDPRCFYIAEVRTFDANIEKEHETFFNSMKKTMTEDATFKIADEDDGGTGGHPGMIFTLEGQNGKYSFRRDVCIGNKVYSLQWVTAKRTRELEQEFGEPFIGSLEIIEGGERPVPPPPSTDDDPPPPPSGGKKPAKVRPPSTGDVPPPPRSGDDVPPPPRSGDDVPPPPKPPGSAE